MSRRVDVSFFGTKEVETQLSVDADEYKGLEPPQITEALKKTLREINKGVSFFEQDISVAAEVIYEANAKPYVAPEE